MNIGNYDEAVKYLEGFIGKVVFRVDPKSVKLHPPLDRMKMLLSLLGNPQDKFKSVLVGGTSGKGSTAYLISHILTTAGYKTGLTISPHLQKINERLQINGKPISDGKFTGMVSSIIRIIEQMRRMKVGEPSYFEILIAMAFLYFAKEKVDIAVVEVGMGGEFDATNTLYPLIAVLTNVSLDHTNILGGTVQKIARTKSGIIKTIKDLRLKIKESDKDHQSSIINHQSIVITGVTQPSVIKIIEDRCGEVGARLYRLGKDFNYYGHPEASAEGSHEILRFAQNDMRGLELSLLGDYQKENASFAIEAVLRLRKFGLRVSEENIKKALKTAFFPGRFEIVKFKVQGSKFKVILDGAHNPTKMKAFLASLKKIFPKQKKVLVVGFKFDKDIPKMLRQITKVADKIIITEFDRATDMNNNASADALNLKSQISNLKYGGEVVVEKDSRKAINKALAMEQFNNETIIVVTGSLYLVGEIRNYLEISNSKLQITNNFQFSKSKYLKN